MKKLSPAERAGALKKLRKWKSATGRDAITRKFEFANFSEAFAFMTRVALLAETDDPLSVHRPRAQAALPADDHPIDALQVDLPEFLQQRLH